jgi:hypothetical protein
MTCEQPYPKCVEAVLNPGTMSCIVTRTSF